MYPLISFPITTLLVYRSYTQSSLTHSGILLATLTALLHAAHPTPLPFTLLVVFFLAGTTATKVKHERKGQLTLSSSAAGGDGGAGRSHVQVLANSGMASALVLVHLWRSWVQWGSGFEPPGGAAAAAAGDCVPTTGSAEGLILAGIVANYAAVAADTFSSELGILATSGPRLLTRPWVKVPRGTNGGVTALGLGAGVLGALVVAVASVVVMPFCAGVGGRRLGPVGRVLMAGEREEAFRGWTVTDKLVWVLVVTVWGELGSVVDSLLGAVLQASVVDRRTGKVVEGVGGLKVLVHGRRGSGGQREQGADGRNGKDATPAEKREESRKVLVGLDWLDNNQVNLLMAACMSLGGMGVAGWWWGIPLSSLWR